MKIKLFDLIFEEKLEEFNAISTGGAGLVSSGLITGMKPVQKGRRRRKAKVISASPAVHNPNALALQEMLENLFEFEASTDRNMARLWADQEPEISSPEQPVKSVSPELLDDVVTSKLLFLSSSTIELPR
jgi:hypothetical protein